MHELAVGQAIVEIVTARAGARPVGRVAVRIGHLRQVVPEALELAWSALTPGTPLEGCALVVEHIAAVIVCEDCGAPTELDWPILLCAGCGSTNVELVSGEELLVATIDVEQEVT